MNRIISLQKTDFCLPRAWFLYSAEESDKFFMVQCVTMAFEFD